PRRPPRTISQQVVPLIAGRGSNQGRMFMNLFSKTSPREELMTFSRRDALKAGAAVAVGTSLGVQNVFAQSETLIQKTIPSSGEMIPPIGIGTNRYGVGESEDERAPLRDTMARFVELGGKVMDTAAVYGTSEVVIGDLAAELGIRDQLFLATKTDIRGRVRGADCLENR